MTDSVGGRPHRLLVISDLHAFIDDGRDDAPSTMALGPGAREGTLLLEHCAEVVSRDFDEIDAILVAGDLTDHADEKALEAVWERLVALSETLQAPLLATAGNHDYDSRGNDYGDPRGALLGLVPPFPFGDEPGQLKYFAHDYAFYETNELIIVSLNSAAQHGYLAGDRPEYDHGRITPATIARLRMALHRRALPATRILLVHHHLTQMPGLDHEETSVMRDGQELIDLLDESGDWIVIHGHKHRPKVRFAAGTNQAPLLFSAGSFSKTLGGGRFGASARNQFYVLEIEPQDRQVDISPAGQIYAFTDSGAGWAPATINDGLPGRSGFGARLKPSVVSRKLMDAAARAKSGALTGDELMAVEPNLRYLTYEDICAIDRQINQSDDHLSSIGPIGFLERVEVEGSGKNR